MLLLPPLLLSSMHTMAHTACLACPASKWALMWEVRVGSVSRRHRWQAVGQAACIACCGCSPATPLECQGAVLQQRFAEKNTFLDATVNCESCKFW